MSHRTYGETKNCKGCRYWSEMLAQCHGGGSVQAMCIAPAGAPNRTKYTSGHITCASWASGEFGAIDEPGQDPNIYEVDAA